MLVVCFTLTDFWVLKANTHAKDYNKYMFQDPYDVLVLSFQSMSQSSFAHDGLLFFILSSKVSEGDPFRSERRLLHRDLPTRHDQNSLRWILFYNPKLQAQSQSRYDSLEMQSATVKLLCACSSLHGNRFIGGQRVPQPSSADSHYISIIRRFASRKDLKLILPRSNDQRNEPFQHFLGSFPDMELSNFQPEPTLEKVSPNDWGFAMSRLGKPKLLCRGNSYIINQAMKNSTQLLNWKCSWQYKKCTAKALMMPSCQLLLKGSHNHPPYLVKSQLMHLGGEISQELLQKLLVC